MISSIFHTFIKINTMKIYSAFILMMVFSITINAQEKVDLNMMAKIREEGLVKSQVMDIALHLTDLNGNRLANSPGYT